MTQLRLFAFMELCDVTEIQDIAATLAVRWSFWTGMFYIINKTWDYTIQQDTQIGMSTSLDLEALKSVDLRALRQTDVERYKVLATARKLCTELEKPWDTVMGMK